MSELRKLISIRKIIFAEARYSPLIFHHGLHRHAAILGQALNQINIINIRGQKKSLLVGIARVATLEKLAPVHTA
jgi:hypothetical protein